MHVFAVLDRGGAETQLMNIYRKLDKNKVQFDFAVNENAALYAYEKEVAALGGRVFRLPKFTGYNYFCYRRAWAALLREHPEWKIIHGHYTAPAFIYLSAAKSLGKITIAHSHTAGKDGSLKSYLKTVTQYPLRFIAGHRFACSDAAARWMFGKRAAHIVRNAIDAASFAYNRETREAARTALSLTDRFVIGHVGNFRTAKNHGFIIDIFAEVKKTVQNAALLLVGGGGLMPQIREKTAKRGLADSVIFAGARADIPDLLNAMDAFLFPSLYEGLPSAVIEAQASGLPCLISDAVSTEAKITDLAAFMPLSQPPDTWAEKIISLARGYSRRNTQGEIKAAGYDAAQAAEWYKDFYQGVSRGAD